MRKITKRHLVLELSNELGMTHREVYDVIQGLINSVTTHLADGRSVVLRNFGVFHVKRVGAIVARNPQYPEKEITLPPRSVVKFRPGKEMREKVADAPAPRQGEAE